MQRLNGKAMESNIVQKYLDFWEIVLKRLHLRVIGTTRCYGLSIRVFGFLNDVIIALLFGIWYIVLHYDLVCGWGSRTIVAPFHAAGRWDLLRMHWLAIEYSRVDWGWIFCCVGALDVTTGTLFATVWHFSYKTHHTAFPKYQIHCAILSLSSFPALSQSTKFFALTISLFSSCVLCREGHLPRPCTRGLITALVQWLCRRRTAVGGWPWCVVWLHKVSCTLYHCSCTVITSSSPILYNVKTTSITHFVQATALPTI